MARLLGAVIHAVRHAPDRRDHHRLGTRMRYGVEAPDLPERQMGGPYHGLRGYASIIGDDMPRVPVDHTALLEHVAAFPWISLCCDVTFAVDLPVTQASNYHVIVYTVTGIDVDGNAIKSEDDGARQQRTVQREPEAKMMKRILVVLAFCAAASPAFAEDGGVVGKLVTPNGTPI